jgi:hypothetical protein
MNVLNNIPIHNSLVALAQCWSKPNEPFLLNIAMDVHTNVYPKMLFGNPITEMEGEANQRSRPNNGEAQ